MRSNSIHESRAEDIISLKADALELLPHDIHLSGIEALLNDTADESRELGFLPALRVAQLGVDEIQALERMVDFDAAEEMGTALLAGIALDGG